MNTSFGNLRRDRQTILSVIMLGVLFVSVGVAWLVAYHGRGPTNRGSGIIQHIREKGLDAFWDRQTVEAWYLGRDEQGKPIAWQRATRRFTDGQYVGTRIIGAAEGVLSRESWRINNTATEGLYEGLSVGRVPVTQIALADGKATVRTGLRARTATSQTPPNYVPEGLSWLVFSLAAKAKQDVSCRMIFDNAALVSGELVNFTAVNLIPAKGNRLRMRVAGGQFDIVYRFDDLPMPEQITHPTGIVYQRVSREELLKHFRLPGLRDSPAPEAGES